MVDNVNQRKEIAGMMALQLDAIHVAFAEGNQTATDWPHQRLGAGQSKGHGLASGSANVGHCKNGVDSQPYDDLFHTLHVYFFFGSPPDVYYMYALIPRHALMKHGIFRHSGYPGYRDGKEPSPGKTTISIPLGIYEEWITGKKTTPDKDHLWLTEPAYGWRVPIKVTAEDMAKLKPGGMPDWWLHGKKGEDGKVIKGKEGVVQDHVAAKPTAKPSKKQLEEHEARIAASEARVQQEVADLAPAIAAAAERAKRVHAKQWERHAPARAAFPAAQAEAQAEAAAAKAPDEATLAARRARKAECDKIRYHAKKTKKDREAAEAAADRSEAAAAEAKASAAKAAEAGPSYVTNNIDNSVHNIDQSNHLHLHAAPPAAEPEPKRLKQ
jgi:hypothetical protein